MQRALLGRTEPESAGKACERRMLRRVAGRGPKDVFSGHDAIRC